MKATTWKGGSYGIRVDKPNAKQYFSEHWKAIDSSTISFLMYLSLLTSILEVQRFEACALQKVAAGLVSLSDGFISCRRLGELVL